MLVTAFIGVKHRFALTGLALLCICVMQCSSRHTQPANSTANREVTDGVGRRVRLAANVDRLVSLAPNLTEIVYAVGGGPYLVGNTTFCDYPAEALTVQKVGDTLHPSIERIISLHPQIVLVSTASQLENFTEQLESHQIAVFVTNPNDLEGVFNSINEIGAILHREIQAAEVVKRLRDRSSFAEASVKSFPPVRVFYQLSDQPLYTAGRDAFVTDLIRRAGGISVTADTPGAWPKYSAESALAARPDAIVLPTGGATGSANSSIANVLQRSPASVQGRIYKINADHLTRPGPRAVDGLEEMARAFHPEGFKQ